MFPNSMMSSRKKVQRTTFRLRIFARPHFPKDILRKFHEGGESTGVEKSKKLNEQFFPQKAFIVKKK